MFDPFLIIYFFLQSFIAFLAEIVCPLSFMQFCIVIDCETRIAMISLLDMYFQATLPNGDSLKERSMSMSDVLGEPFATPVSSKNMHRYGPSSL